MPRPIVRAASEMLLATASFAVMTMLVRVAGRSLDPLFLVWIRGLLGFCILWPYLYLRQISILGTHRAMLLIRAAVGCVGVCLVFFSAKWIPVSDAVSLFMTSALYVPFVAAVFLKEHLHWHTVKLASLGFLGMLLIVQPGFAEINRGIFYGLAAGVVHAFVYTTLRGLSSREHSLTVVGYFLGGSALFTTPWVAFPTTLPQPATLFIILGIVISGFLGQIFLTRAYAHAPAARVTPYIYGEVVFAALLGWYFLSEIPNLPATVGMALICASGWALSRVVAPATDIS